MKPKQLLLVVVLALVLGGLGLFVARRQSASFQTSGAGAGQKVLPNFPLNDVAQVLLREGTNELSLVREAEVWKVRERYNYPAAFTELGDFLRKVWDLKVVQSEDVGASQLPRLQLLEPGPGTNTAVRVDFKDASGKPLAGLLLGKKHMRKGDPNSPMGGEGFPDGRWVMAVGGAKQASLVSEAFTEIESKPDRWLNKDFFKVEKLQSLEVTHASATNSWKLSRDTEGGELKLADAKPEEKLDTSKASPAGSALSWPSFVDVVAPDAKPEQTGLTNALVAKLQTFDGFAYTVEIGARTPEDNYHLRVSVSADLPKERAAGKDEKPEDKERLDKEFKEKNGKLEEKLKQEKAYSGWVYLVSKWTIEPLLKERRELMEEKKEETPPAEGTPPAPAPAVPAVLENPLAPPPQAP